MFRSLGPRGQIRATSGPLCGRFRRSSLKNRRQHGAQPSSDLRVPFVLMSVACDAIQAWTLRVRVVCASDRVSRATLEIVEDLKNSGGPISCPPCCGIPEANGIAERFVRTVRSKCLDRLLIVNRRHLERTLTVFVDHDNGYRPHRSLDLAPPNGRRAIENWTGTRSMAVKRGDRLGGLLHEYEPAT
jgi:hypothetical protein